MSLSNIKVLPIIFKKNGFVYEQFRRGNQYAIYAQKYTLNSEPIAYEVFQIQIRGYKEFKGKTIPPYESMPANSDWGQKGWTYRSLEQAYKKLSELELRLYKETKTIAFSIVSSKAS